MIKRTLADLCFSTLQALDVNSPFPNESLNSGAPWESYNPVYLGRVFAVVEAFKDYPNTLLFFSGNEVISNVAVSKIVPQYIRVRSSSLFMQAPLLLY
jgi:hypothetical protein